VTIKTRVAALIALVVLSVAPRAVTAQTALEPFRVQLHVSADVAVKTAALSSLSIALQRVRDIDVTARDGEFVLSVVVVPTTAGGFAASATMMAVYTDRALADIAARLALPAASRDQLVAQFKGAGALLDQRVLTAANLDSLCADIAGAVDADILARERRFRGGNK
jgi:hypothetical protein